MTVGDIIAIASALVSVAAAAIAWRQKDAAKRSARAAEDQVAAMRDQATSQRDQADVMLREEDRQRREYAASQLARLEVWRETRQPKGGGAAIVIENKGLAPARFPKVEVRATGCGDVNVFEDEHMPSFASREELRSEQPWLISFDVTSMQGAFLCGFKLNGKTLATSLKHAHSSQWKGLAGKGLVRARRATTAARRASS